MRSKAQDTILRLLYLAGTEGMTYKELCEAVQKGHGTVSGALSLLHEDGDVFYLQAMREHCHIYIHSDFRLKFDPKDRNDYPRKSIAPRYLEIIEKIVTAYRSGVGLDEAIENAEKYL